jgi:hypothetical protein
MRNTLEVNFPTSISVSASSSMFAMICLLMIAGCTADALKLKRELDSLLQQFRDTCEKRQAK